jgi:hypothetical protein
MVGAFDAADMPDVVRNLILTWGACYFGMLTLAVRFAVHAHLSNPTENSSVCRIEQRV